MNIDKELLERANSSCELCGNSEELCTFKVEPKDDEIVICSTCKSGLEDLSSIDESHWNCLNDSMWSEVSAVKVVSYRLLNSLKRQDLLDMMYLEDDEKSWAEALASTETLSVKDANGVPLNAGDSVVILKDLDVKGAGFTAKRGTTVKNISIPADVEGHVEGRVNGVKIYLKTEFLKKA